MPMIISPLIRLINICIRVAFFIWVVKFLRCFANLQEDIDHGHWQLTLIDLLILLLVFAATIFITWKVGESITVNTWRCIGYWLELVISDLQHHQKVRAAEKDSMCTFENELANAAADQLESELVLVEAANWDFDAVMKIADEAEADARIMSRRGRNRPRQRLPSYRNNENDEPQYITGGNHLEFKKVVRTG